MDDRDLEPLEGGEDDDALAWRRRVYQQGLWALSMGPGPAAAHGHVRGGSISGAITRERRLSGVCMGWFMGEKVRHAGWAAPRVLRL